MSDGLEAIIKIVIDSYGKYKAGQLIKLTHEEEPWQKTPINSIIIPDIIQEYFDKYIIIRYNPVVGK